MRKATLVLVVAAIMTISTRLNAGPRCHNPPVLPPQYGWADGQVVHVNIDPHFPPFDREAIQETFEAWQSAVANRITFAFTSEPTPIVDVDGRGENNAVQVDRSFRLIQLNVVARTLPVSEGGHLVRAWMRFSPLIADTHALRNHAAHEIGHTMGLADCRTGCERGTSVMNLVAGVDDRYSGRQAPSACDVVTAREALGFIAPRERLLLARGHYSRWK
jgi:hypothetical protein